MLQNACWSPAHKQIGLRGGLTLYRDSAGRVVEEDLWLSGGLRTVLHELAHVYHQEVVPGGFGNVCIADAYEGNVHRYYDLEGFQAGENSRGRALFGYENYPYLTRNAPEYFAELSVLFFLGWEKWGALFPGWAFPFRPRGVRGGLWGLGRGRGPAGFLPGAGARVVGFRLGWPPSLWGATTAGHFRSVQGVCGPRAAGLPSGSDEEFFIPSSRRRL